MPRLTDPEFDALLLDAAAGAAAAEDLERAFAALTAAARAGLGDPDAAAAPGGLKAGERDYRIGGVFLVTPDRRYNMLVASAGFPPEQRRLCIPIDWNHPGVVVADRRPVLVANTDADAGFRQFLKTSRMGSSIYHPFFAGGRLVGQIVAASQARLTYDATDLARLGRLAWSAALSWASRSGEAWLAADYPAPDLWRAEEHA
ncbi:GAF domain-containing protein [Albimonas donghaensis]|uniref:GAF domain-containing protein n=1 Tax=Albimonas donghaensis TaxID=356660 RepID=A0A1H3BMT8_9RHOB|nr:GAF domain-containing protein [Albimonas donghaensis]SDX43048.1 GAF domain-containing protein [Albimonas donghaensis]